MEKSEDKDGVQSVPGTPAEPEVEIVESEARHFRDPTIDRAMTEDPVIRWFASNWRGLFIAVCAAGAVIFIQGRFEQTRDLKLSDAAELYAMVGRDFAALDGKEGATEKKEDASAKDPVKEKEEIRRRFSEAVNAMGDSSAPYDLFAPVYRGLEGIKSGSIEEAKSSLGESFSAPGRQEDVAAQLLSEVKAVSVGRAMLDDSSTAARGREILSSVATSGKYLDVAAAVSLAESASTSEERSQAKRILDTIIAAQPEQSAVLEKPLARVSG